MNGCPWQVSVAILPDPAEPSPPPRLNSVAYLLAEQACGELTEACRTARPEPARSLGGAAEAALTAAANSSQQLAQMLLAIAPHVSDSSVSDTNPIRSYFAVRSATLSAPQAAAQEALVVARGLADLLHAPVDRDDLLAELAAFRAVLRDFLLNKPSKDSSRVVECPPLLADSASKGSAAERWVVGHQVYLMFNIRAATTVQLALRALNQDRSGDAVRHLTAAAGYVRGFTGAMGHAGAMPGAVYRQKVRPTMAPPAVSVPLTGRMHKEHRAFRAALTQLLKICGESATELADKDPALAWARAALLEADLADIQRHVLLAAALVGEDRSLVQRRDSDSAVRMLREMHLLREAQYRSLLALEDDLVAASLGVARTQAAAAAAQ